MGYLESIFHGLSDVLSDIQLLFQRTFCELPQYDLQILFFPRLNTNSFLDICIDCCLYGTPASNHRNLLLLVQQKARALG